MAWMSSAVTWDSTSSSRSARPAARPAAAAASMPFSPPVLGTVTAFTFLMILPLTSTRQRSGTVPNAIRALAAAKAMAMGSVQPMAGISSSSKIFT